VCGVCGVGGLNQLLRLLCCVCVDRDRESLLHWTVHSRDATQGVQPRIARIPHVTVQSFRLFRRAVQYC